MTPDAIYAALLRFPTFAGLDRARDDDALTRIALITLDGHATLFREGDAADDLFVVKRGTIELVRIRDGIITPVAHQTAGDIFGELGLLEGTPRNATARALTEAAVFRIPRDVVTTLAARIPALDAAIAMAYFDRKEKNKYYAAELHTKGLSLYATAPIEDRSDEVM